MARIPLLLSQLPGAYPANLLNTVVSSSGTDGVTDGSNTFTSASAAWTTRDVGRELVIAGDRRYITAVTDPNTVEFDGATIGADTDLSWYVMTGLGGIAQEPADTGDGNKAAAGGRDLLIIENTGAGAHNVSVTAVGSPATSISNYSVGANKIARLGPFPAKGWKFSDGLHINGAHAELLLTVLSLPPIR